MSHRKFTATLLKHPTLDSAYFEIPFDVEKEYGKKRVKVKALIDGELYRGSLVRMGLPCWWLGVTQEMRKKIRKNPGDSVEIVLEEDLEERVIEVPLEVAAVLKTSPKAARFFESLSYTSKKEYIRWISEAKKEETRKSRLLRLISLLEAGKREP